MTITYLIVETNVEVSMPGFTGKCPGFTVKPPVVHLHALA
jgi:hypothetical protein